MKFIEAFPSKLKCDFSLDGFFAVLCARQRERGTAPTRAAGDGVDSRLLKQRLLPCVAFTENFVVYDLLNYDLLKHKRLIRSSQRFVAILTKTVGMAFPDGFINFSLLLKISFYSKRFERAFYSSLSDSPYFSSAFLISSDILSSVTSKLGEAYISLPSSFVPFGSKIPSGCITTL